LENLNYEEESYLHICAEIIMIIRHYNDYSFFQTKVLPYAYYNKNNYLIGWNNYLNTIYLNKIRYNKTLIDDNKLIIASNIRIFNYDKELYINELRSMINNNNNDEDFIDEIFYEWEIENWNEINNSYQQNSPDFTVGNNQWNITLYPKGKFENENDYLSIYLNNNNTGNINVYTYFVISIRNPKNYSYFIGKNEKYVQCFNRNSSELRSMINNNNNDEDFIDEIFY